MSAEHPAKMQPSGNVSKIKINPCERIFYRLERVLRACLYASIKLLYLYTHISTGLYSEKMNFPTFVFRFSQHLPNKSVTIHAPTGHRKNTRQVKSPLPPLLFLMQLYNDIMSWFFPFLSVCLFFFWRSWSYLSPASSASIKQTCSFEKLTSRWWRGSTRECAPYYVLHLILL